MTGRQFLKFLSRMRGTRDAAKQKETALPIKGRRKNKVYDGHG